MSPKKFGFLLSLMLIFNQVNAQAPEGFSAGSLLLPDGSQLTGWVKESFNKNGMLLFTSNEGKRRQYNASEINGATIGNTKYQCINGDFFTIISFGKMCFLQKKSHVAGRTIYNGSEPIVLMGTPGKTGDYFLYQQQQLTHITANNLNSIIQDNFGQCAPAKEKAIAISGNIAALADAVNLYNSLNP
jgi:hypothetical protein